MIKFTADAICQARIMDDGKYKTCIISTEIEADGIKENNTIKIDLTTVKAQFNDMFTIFHAGGYISEIDEGEITEILNVLEMNNMEMKEDY